VGSDWHEKTWIRSKKYAAVSGFADHWKKAPVVFEWFGPHEHIVGRNWSFDSAVEFMLRNHVTYINDNVGKVTPADWPKVEKLSRLAGYRFVLREVTCASAARPGSALAVRMSWENAGIGKMYRKHHVVLCLLKRAGKTMCEQKQGGVHPREWPR
jgi:hypothetical protein